MSAGPFFVTYVVELIGKRLLDSLASLGPQLIKRLHNRLVLMISIKGLLLYLFEYLEVPSPREDPGGSLGPIGFPVCISIDLLRHFILQGFPPGKPNPSALAGIHASSFLVLHDVASLD